MTALAEFFDQYIFGHDRAALLSVQLPATAADHAERQARHTAHLRAELARIDTAERALIKELEQPADPGDPASQAYRARIRERYAELYGQRTSTEAKLATLQTAAPQSSDPALLDQLPIAATVMAGAPDRIKAALMAAFDIQALYNKDMNQVTIWATITDDTPRTIAALLTDPRTDDDTGHAPAAVSHSGPGPIVPRIHRRARINRNKSVHYPTSERIRREWGYWDELRRPAEHDGTLGAGEHQRLMRTRYLNRTSRRRASRKEEGSGGRVSSGGR
jgi:hypothetical protein